jgi:nuclear transport factor 2 (NTF2) superfamily protein
MLPGPSAARGEEQMDEKTMHAIAENLLEAWNSQDVDRVVACYTDDLVYLDPNTRGEVKGADAMRRYLRKLFVGWKMSWSLKEAHLFEGRNGCAAMWRASFQRPDGGEAVEADGMDLVLVEGHRVKRNEVYFDRTVLSPLI